MQTFFASIQSLDAFTRSLASLAGQTTCAFCSQPGQWVSHGYVYKQTSSTQRDKVGKRILCSNRSGKQGCGRTRSLYLASVMPRCRYRLKVLLVFLACLLNGATIAQAYHQAIGHDHFEPRQASRWLTALYRQLSGFRRVLGKRARDDGSDKPCRSHRLNRLLPTIRQLFAGLPTPDSVQLRFQRALM